MLHDFSTAELDRYWSLARRMAGRWCLAPTDADDAAQEVILRLLRQNAKPVHDVAWLYVVTRRVCNRMRLLALRRQDVESSYASTLPGEHHSDLPIDVAKILRGLPARDQVILQLIVEGVRAREIAAILGCKTRDVGQLVSRARRRARRLRDG